MAAPRHVNIPSPICSPRNTLTTVQQGNVDAVLKDLKACTRRLQAALASFQIELQILEKLYYKGNNQHRTALFWRRVADVRRFGRRLETLKIQESLDTIRLSFWGQPSERSAKALKGSWTHVPDINSVLCVLERFRSCLVFVDSMEEHLTKAHNHFNLDLQTGAFLQLILTLTAITSRMAILLTEIGPVVANSWAAFYRLTETLSSHESRSPPKRLGGRYKSIDPRNSHVLKVPRRAPLATQATHEFGEDIGSALPPRVSNVDTGAAKQAASESFGEGATDKTIATEDLGFQFSAPVVDPTVTPVARTTVERVSKAKVVDKKARKREKSTASETQEGHAKKKRKKKDEIDDIFGF